MSVLLLSQRRTRLVLALLCVSSMLTVRGQSVEPPQELVNRLFQTSFQALREDELEKAESDTREILGIALDQLGVIYGTLREFERAERAFQEATRASVRGASTSLLGLAILYMRTGDYDKSIESIQKILALNPLHPEARHALGKVYFLQGRFSDAASALQDSYRTRPDDVSVAYTLALAYLKQKRLEPAVQVFQELEETLGDAPQLHVLIGRAYRETGYHAKAVEELQTAIRMQPDVPRAHHYLGLTYLLQRQSAAFPEAEAAFQKELEIEPEAYFPNFFLGVIYTQTRRNQEAITHLRRAAQSSSRSPDPYLHLGQALFQDGKFEQAAESLTRCLELTTDPSRNNYQIAKAHYILGRSLLKLGQRDAAAVHLRQSEELKLVRSAQEKREMQAHIKGLPPELTDLDSTLSDTVSEGQSAVILDTPRPDAEASAVLTGTASFYLAASGNGYQQMARIMTELQRLQRAAQYLERAVYWQPDTQGAFLNLAVARVKTGDTAGAVEPLIEAVRRGQSQDEARNLLANLALQLVEQRQPGPAQQAVDFLLESNPEIPELHLLRGHVKAQRGHFAEAADAYGQALALSPRLPEAHFHTGTVLIRLGRLEEALAEFEQELARDPRHPKALYHKAFVLASRQEFDAAELLLRQVIELDPQYADAYYQLGKIQLDSGKLLLATANLETAAYYAPRASHIQYQLSRAYSKGGRQADAQRALERYRQIKREEEEAQLSLRQLDKP